MGAEREDEDGRVIYQGDPGDVSRDTAPEAYAKRPDPPYPPPEGFHWVWTQHASNANEADGFWGLEQDEAKAPEVTYVQQQPPPTTTTGTTTTTTTTGDGRRGPIGGPPSAVQQAVRPASAGMTGVPTSYQAPPVTGMPTLASAIQDAKQLPQAPTISPYAEFTPAAPVGLEARNRLVESILTRPQTMDQTAQDQLFEQQKEQQEALRIAGRNRLAQQGAGRGLSSYGGQQIAGDVQLEQGFAKSLIEGRRDIALKANEINRQNELAAVEMANAVNQGDFARAQAAYETQLKAKQAYDALRFQAAEFERGNVALAAQTAMAGRQQAQAEAMANFQQYMEQRKFDEMMRQFNEQLGYNYGTFGWQQQKDIFDRS